MATMIHITTAPANERKEPRLGDRRYLKGRGVWQIRVYRRCPLRGLPMLSAGRQLYDWVDDPIQGPKP